MQQTLQKYFKSPIPGWLSVLAGAAWEALEHYEKVERIVPLPPWSLFAVGILWVVLAKRSKDILPAEQRPTTCEVVIFRERTTTVEREYVVRRDS